MIRRVLGYLVGYSLLFFVVVLGFFLGFLVELVGRLDGQEADGEAEAVFWRSDWRLQTKKGISVKEHHWSGWPGAFCFHCGNSDPIEVAIGNDWYDPYAEKWVSKERRLEFEAANICNPPKISWSEAPCPQCKSKGGD